MPRTLTGRTSPRQVPSVSQENIVYQYEQFEIIGANMAKKKDDTSKNTNLLREHAEYQFAEELEELGKVDKRQRPPNWNLSPWAVMTYLMGGKLDSGFEVSPKYIGEKRVIEIAIATLTTDRGLLLIGVPGTAKSWVSEHLAAAISGILSY